ncbi:hypothetical protein L211DRAFT_853271 [Terfezia boudieri ATCC MYA-4762]|uniref:Uncharacterized protein n=1 Tax=Terfezia boudieri ATCC MYA-4762 TaxID=1051890 RepID=A0A3N4L8Z7_9PEZI|nr:hypothetical protein L211DRAFT_853271 [Terfezia boudieri ATCC MYA-4762]
MASLSSIPRRRFMAAPVRFLSINSFSVSVSQRRNYWVYHHSRQVVVSKLSLSSQDSSSGEPQDGHGEQSKPTCYHYSITGGTKCGSWGWGGREDGWRTQRWAFVRRLSSGGPDGDWTDGNPRFTPEKNSKDRAGDQDIDSTNENAKRALITDFLSPDYESRFLMWKEKQQKRLLERLRKEFEEQEKELLDRQRKEVEEKEKREWKLWKKEFKEARGFENALREKEMKEKEREKEREKEKQMRNSEHVKDGSKTVPHPVPVLHPYSRVPIYEKETIDAEETTEVKRKEIDRDAVAYREQKGQPGKGGVEEIESPLVVEAAAEGVDPVVGLQVTRVPGGVDPLNGEGLPVTQATDSPAMVLPVAEKVGEEVVEAGPQELGQGAEPPSSKQLVEVKLGEVEPTPTPEEVGDASLLVESTEKSGNQVLRLVEAEHTPQGPVVESTPEISAPKIEGEPAFVPPPPLLEAELVDEPSIAAAPPFAKPAPSTESASKVEEVNPSSPPAPEALAVTTKVEEVNPPARKAPAVTTKVEEVNPPAPEAPAVTTKVEEVNPPPPPVPEASAATTKVEEVNLPSPPAPEALRATNLPKSVSSELSQIKESLSQVTNVVSRLDNTMDYELNSILIQLRRWRREVEKLSSTSGIIPPQRNLFVEDVAVTPEAAEECQSGPMEYKILSLSPTPPHHLLTTDLSVANAATVDGEKDISEFLSKLKVPYLFLQRVPKLTSEGWKIVSGSTEMLMFARKPVAGALDGSTTAVIPAPGESTTTTELMNTPAGAKTVFESSSTHGYVDQETGTIVLKPGSEDEKKRLMYNFNDDGHLHFYGHGLGGIAGDGVSFSGINLTHRVNPIDMTMQFESPSDASSSSSSEDGFESNKQEVDHAWNEKRTNAVRSMREGLRLGKAQEEARARVAEVEDVEEKRRVEEEEARILEEIKAVDNAVHGQAIAWEAAAAADRGLPPSQEEAEQQGQQRKKGGRVGRFFKRLGWTVVWLGAGVVLVKEVGYWSQKAEEKQKKVGGQEVMERDGLGAKEDGAGGGERWGGARPGSRYSWSERESVKEGRWGSGSGRTWGEERR